MDKPNFKNDIAKKEKEFDKKIKKKKKIMKVSGGNVKKLQKIISNKTMKVFFAFLLFCFFYFPGTALAEQTIDDFTVKILINSDASLHITESIIYNFGDDLKHGIFRDIPVNYKVKGGKYSLKMSDIGVVDPIGQAYEFEVLSKGDYKSIKIGNANDYVTGRKKYIISYRVDRALNFFDDHDELYWNVTGDSWEVDIKQARAEVYLPTPMPEDNIDTACYAGVVASSDKCISQRYSYARENFVNSISFTNDKISAGEGMTVVVGMPKGIITKPSLMLQIWNVFKDNIILALPILVFIFLFYLWRTRGRDPKGRGTIIAQFDAPDDLSPAEVGTIFDETAHNKDISAEIIYLAVQGYLKIEKIAKTGILKGSDYKLKKLKSEADLKNEFSKELMLALFKSKEEIRLSELKNKFYKDLKKITKAIYASTVVKGYFPVSPNKVRGTYTAIGVVLLVFGWFLGPIFGGFGLAGILASGGLVIIFGMIMPVKTRKGVLAKEYILGLKKYLEVAEKDRIKFHNAPSKNPKIFEKLLPFAMVLGVEKEWAGQFVDIYNQAPSWYADPSGGHFSALALTNGLSAFSAKTNTTLASSPSSAAGGGSGFSGGSGGGFGGGGGGSW